MGSKSDCRRGKHRYDFGIGVGGGILRRTCRNCETVQIDVSRSGAESPGRSGLFRRPRLDSIFQLAAAHEAALVSPTRRFGEAPAGRRTAVMAGA